MPRGWKKEEEKKFNFKYLDLSIQAKIKMWSVIQREAIYIAANIGCTVRENIFFWYVNKDHSEIKGFIFYAIRT